VKNQSVLTAAPLRVSFIGGGTDIENFYSIHSGSVVSSAINKYVYVHIKNHDPLFQEKYRVSYSDVEHTSDRKSIRNLIVRNSLEFLNIDEPLQISTSADLPSNSGLGSSSSFTVALLSGLHALKGEEVSSAQIAEEACHVEIELIKSPIGKQDQYAAAIGGFNQYIFSENGTVKIRPLRIAPNKLDTFADNLNLVWTGLIRDANSILKSQSMRAKDNDLNLLLLNRKTEVFLDMIEKPDVNLDQLGYLISEGWQIKKQLEPSIVTTEIIALEDEIRNASFMGLKLLGAGGGGFFLAFGPTKNFDKSETLLKTPKFKPKIDHFGVRVLSII
jgi:D-glycero-alpha-D-manno-heptose-7-phosphate kinase